MRTNQRIVAFGEIMLRLSPADYQGIRDATAFQACYGGSEANVLLCLSTLGQKTSYLTALPDNPLGEAAVKHLNSFGVSTELVQRQGDVMGMYFLEQGFGARPSQVIYHRKHSAVTDLTPGSFDFDAVFRDCGWFHVSGISFALSDSVRELCFELLREAKRRGITVSFDFNYRGKLWTVERAAEVYRDIVPFVDVLFCSRRDLNAFLSTDLEHFYDAYFTPLVFVREREIVASNRHLASASVYTPTNGAAECVASVTAEFDVLDRVGSGDAFVAGVLFSLSSAPEDYAEALRFGMGCFELKHTVPGDALMVNRGTVYALMDSGPADVKR